MMVPEAPLEQTEDGLLPAGEGWFVLNAREAAWRRWEGMGKWPRLEGTRPIFPQLGIGLTVLEPGEPMTMYHWETDQEDFLVLSGEALAIVEGQERPLRQWDFLHCPAGTNHAIVGAGDGPCIVFAVGSRENHTYRTPREASRGPTTGAPTRWTRPRCVRARASRRRRTTRAWPTAASRSPCRRAAATAGSAVRSGDGAPSCAAAVRRPSRADRAPAS